MGGRICGRPRPLQSIKPQLPGDSFVRQNNRWLMRDRTDDVLACHCKDLQQFPLQFAEWLDRTARAC